jgi:hypothetical protein
MGGCEKITRSGYPAYDVDSDNSGNSAKLLPASASHAKNSDAEISDRRQPRTPLRCSATSLCLAGRCAEDQPDASARRLRRGSRRGRRRQDRLRRGGGRSGSAPTGGRLRSGHGRRRPEALRHRRPCSDGKGLGRRSRSRLAHGVAQRPGRPTPDRDRAQPRVLPGARFSRRAAAVAQIRSELRHLHQAHRDGLCIGAGEALSGRLVRARPHRQARHQERLARITNRGPPIK